MTPMPSIKVFTQLDRDRETEVWGWQLVGIIRLKAQGKESASFLIGIDEPEPYGLVDNVDVCQGPCELHP